jgi:hypothetical protein
VAQAYYKKRGFGSAQEVREEGESVEGLSPYSQTRDSAVAGDFIKLGRKQLQTGTVVESSGPWDQQSMGSDFSPSLFVRLTDAGERQLEDNAEVAREAMDAITGEPLSPSVDSVTPSEEQQMEDLQIGEVEAVAAPNAAGGARGGRGGGGRGRGRGRGSGAGGESSSFGMGTDAPRRSVRPQRSMTAALCGRFMRSGQCFYGDRCGFNHGGARPISLGPRRTICNFFGVPVGCKQGNQCRFVHNPK